MKYSVALKVIRINNVFNNEHTKELIYEAVDKYGQTYEFKSEARIPMNNYIACEFNKYTIVDGAIRPINFSIYPLNVKDNKLYLYNTLYVSKNYPKIN